MDETRSPFDLEVSLRETPPVDMCSADRVAYLCERSVNKVTFLYKCSVLALWEACRSGKFLKLEPSVIERREKKLNMWQAAEELLTNTSVTCYCIRKTNAVPTDEYSFMYANSN